MADVFTSEKRSAIMRAVHSRDTTPELLVRRLVWRLGYRYRLCLKMLPGCPDIVFRSRRKVIFVHGCFWHGHGCARGSRRPKTRHEYWDAKRARNQARDVRNRRELRQAGWDVLVVWECQTVPAETLPNRIQGFLERQRSDLIK